MKQSLPFVSGVLIGLAGLQLNNMAPPAWFFPYMILVSVDCIHLR
jgi:hypothetical protein